MRSFWRQWQTLAILGRMVSQSRCPRMTELAIGKSGGPRFHAEGREHRFQERKSLACFRSSQRPEYSRGGREQ